jgi:hypothetical protein
MRLGWHEEYVSLNSAKHVLPTAPEIEQYPLANMLFQRIVHTPLKNLQMVANTNWNHIKICHRVTIISETLLEDSPWLIQALGGLSSTSVRSVFTLLSRDLNFPPPVVAGCGKDSYSFRNLPRMTPPLMPLKRAREQTQLRTHQMLQSV